jgi:hypothetical protein
MLEKPLIVVTGGGSGGHTMVAAATISYLLENDLVRVAYVGSHDGVEGPTARSAGSILQHSYWQAQARERVVRAGQRPQRGGHLQRFGRARASGSNPPAASSCSRTIDGRLCCSARRVGGRRAGHPRDPSRTNPSARARQSPERRHRSEDRCLEQSFLRLVTHALASQGDRHRYSGPGRYSNQRVGMSNAGSPNAWRPSARRSWSRMPS